MSLHAYQLSVRNSCNGSEFPYQPDAVSALQAIQNDLQRETASNALKSAGSDTAYNLRAPGLLSRSLYGADYSGGGAAPRAVGGLLGGAGGLLTGRPWGAAARATPGQQAVAKRAPKGNQRG